ncbi:MAG: low molecular weight phosphotyrosine protein phosphatase [Betaproteobacteria bacterium]|nr:low molecular weight phosphotyrosine protein phosphatase [Betaproteobacteria bacterium]
MPAVLFVCTGNICRSPTAEAVFRRLVRDAGLDGSIRVDSAATHDYHVGEPPDERAQRQAMRRGYDLSALRARRVAQRDFEEFDFIVAMDRSHLRILRRLCPGESRHKLRLIMEFAPELGADEVPDPYYGDSDQFEQVLDMVEAAARGLLRSVSANR